MRVATSKHPSRPTVVLIAKRHTSETASLPLPCSRLFSAFDGSRRLLNPFEKHSCTGTGSTAS